MSASQDEQSQLYVMINKALKQQQLSRRTEQRYLFWMKKFIHFHKGRNLNSMRETHIQEFLKYLSLRLEVSTSSQNVARMAVVFLFQQVLKKPLVPSAACLSNKNINATHCVAA